MDQMDYGAVLPPSLMVFFSIISNLNFDLFSNLLILCQETVDGHWSVYKWRFYCATALSLLPSENKQVWLDDIAERKEHFYLENCLYKLHRNGWQRGAGSGNPWNVWLSVNCPITACLGWNRVMHGISHASWQNPCIMAKTMRYELCHAMTFPMGV